MSGFPLAHLAASQLQMMKNHLNPLWWKAPCPGSGWITRKGNREPHRSNWACSPPAGGMAALPHLLGSPWVLLPQPCSWLSTAILWFLLHSNASRQNMLPIVTCYGGLGKCKVFLWVFLCLSSLFPLSLLSPPLSSPPLLSLLPFSLA